MNRRISVAIIFLIGVVFLANGPHRYLCAEDVQGSLPSEALLVMCSSDRLFVDTVEPLDLRVYTHPKGDESFHYTWTVTAGRIEGTGPHVKWNLAGAKPSVYRLTVRVTDAQGHSGTAQLEVVVIKPLDLKGGKYTTGRAFLLRDKKEDEGYGLYSYLLLASRPDESKRERYLSTIRAYLRLSHVTELFELLKEKEQINITYLPLKRAPGKNLLLGELSTMSEQSYSEMAAWVLENYDYDRAQTLLNKLEGDHQGGPYIVSFLKPMSGDKPEPPYLYQDQSTVPPNLAALWMNEFIMQAAQEQFWERKTMYHMVLKMRTYLGIIGEGVQEVTRAVTILIELKDKLKLRSSGRDRTVAADNRNTRGVPSVSGKPGGQACVRARDSKLIDLVAFCQLA